MTGWINNILVQSMDMKVLWGLEPQLLCYVLPLLTNLSPQKYFFLPVLLGLYLLIKSKHIRVVLI